jgi:SAM-dependent methyltransferase
MFKIVLCLTILVITLIIIWIFLVFILKSLLNPQKTAPYVSSFKRHLDLMKNLKIKKWSKILDLWCGDGKALRFFYKNFDINNCTGYDINPYAILIWKALNKLSWYKKINLHKKNFLNISLKWYDYIYVYLRPSQLAKIEDRLRKNKDKNTIVISNSFQFTKHKEFDYIKNTKNKKSIFLYI